MEAESYVASDPSVMDRDLIHYLFLHGSLRSINTVKVYLILLAACKWSVTTFEDGTPQIARIINNGQLKFTSTKARDIYKIPRSGFYKAIGDLQARGLIEITKRGGGGGNRYAICTPENLKSVIHRLKATEQRAHEREFIECVRDYISR